MIHTAPLNTKHIVEDEIITESESYLNEHGYKTDDKRYYTVVNHKPDDKDSGHLIKVVETTAVPFDDADLVADTVEVYICSCSSYRYGKGIDDLEDRRTLEWHTCKHCDALSDLKAKRAEQDDNQTEL